MNKLTVSRKRAFSLLAIGVLAAPTAYSQAIDTSKWVCEYCPFENGQRSDVSVGASSVSDDSAYVGDASGYSESGIYANVDGVGSYVNDGHQLRWQIEDLGLDSRYAGLQGGRQGSFDYDFSYRQIPRQQYFTTDTIFLQSADVLVLPDDWVRAPLTSDFTELNGNLKRRNIESERRILEIGGNYLPSRRVKLSANYQRQERDGYQTYGGSYFTQSSLLPGSFDYATDTMDLGLHYIGDSGMLSLAYYVSEFDNSDSELRWESPFTTAPGAEVAALARPPDNNFQQLALSGQYRFPLFNTVAGFSAAMGHMQQDASFLPYTTNSNLAVSPLPRTNLDAEVDTTNLAVSVSSNFTQKLRVNLTYRYDERDNKTALSDWSRVITDTFLSGESETNTPYSFERSTLGLSAEYKLFRSVRVSGGFDRKTIDRNFQEVAEQTEDTGWGRLRWRGGSGLLVDFRAGASERDIDQYNETYAATLGQNPLMRKYNLAYRYRRFGELTLAASLGETPLSLTINGLYADDDYLQSQLGISTANDFRVAADLSWALSDKSSLYFSLGSENIESQQFGSESFAMPDWRALNEDQFLTTGVGFRIRQVFDKVDVQMDYTRSDGSSKINLESASGESSKYPDLESTLDYLRVQLAYAQSDRLHLTMQLRYQTFLAQDWALEGVGPVTIPVVLTLGASPYDDEIFILGLGFRYLIGGAEE